MSDHPAELFSELLPGLQDQILRLLGLHESQLVDLGEAVKAVEERPVVAEENATQHLFEGPRALRGLGHGRERVIVSALDDCAKESGLVRVARVERGPRDLGRRCDLAQRGRLESVGAERGECRLEDGFGRGIAIGHSVCGGRAPTLLQF